MGYVYKKKRQSVLVCESAECDGCKGEIPLAAPAEVGIGSLEVELSGGYVSFFDGRHKSLLCESCAKKLMGAVADLFPEICKSIKEDL